MSTTPTFEEPSKTCPLTSVKNSSSLYPLRSRKGSKAAAVTLHLDAQGKLLESVKCRNTRCSTPNGKRRAGLQSCATPACGVCRRLFTASARRLRPSDQASASAHAWSTVSSALSCHGPTRQSVMDVNLRLPIPLVRLIRRLVRLHLRGCIARRAFAQVSQPWRHCNLSLDGYPPIHACATRSPCPSLS
jgi:hypothetical protein